ncbi:MAG: class I SAM-dependent methyltransferase [Candidatus Woesearchaeota archaeon]
MEHYFSENPKSQFIKEKFDIEILGNIIHINSGSGLFSLKELDFGTELLIKNAKIINDTSKVLDLGCGYGIVGIALKKQYPDIDITLCDINDRAVKISKQNCDENDVVCSVIKSDILSNPNIDSQKFDVILTNPPFSAGKKVCIEFITQSFNHLNDNGSLQLVAPHNKGGESLKKVMLEIFGNVDELCKKRGYRVYYSVKK